MDIMIMKVVLRYIIIMNGVLCVMIIGQLMKLMLCVENLDSLVLINTYL